MGFRHHKDDYENPKRARFLVGNVFLKNFYSVYDYDQQEVRLGVNIHSKGLATIRKYKRGHTWSPAQGYKQLDFYNRRVLKKEEDDWMK